MAKKILGYEVAPREQQLRVAKYLLLCVIAFPVLLVAGLAHISHVETRGREPAIAVITAFDTKCRYKVRNIGRRVTYYDHTGLIDCATAEAVARENNTPLGSVQPTTVADITFETKAGEKVKTRVELRRNVPQVAGELVEVLYDLDDPADVKEFGKYGIFGKQSIMQKPEKTKTAVASVPQIQAEPQSKSKPKDAFAHLSRTTRVWVGLGVVIVGLLLVYFILSRLWRLARRLLGWSKPSPASVQTPASQPRSADAPARAPLPRPQRTAPAPARLGGGSSLRGNDAAFAARQRLQRITAPRG